MSEEKLNEAMQYNLDYTEAMLSDELFGGNEVAEVKLLASEKTIKDLQQKVEQLEKENEKLKQPQVFIDCEDMEERYGRDLYEDYLKEKIEQLENIRKEAIEYIENPRHEMSVVTYQNLLNILNKGSENNELD